MNRWEKEVQASLLDSENSVIKEIEKQYAKALSDIDEKIKLFQSDIDMLDSALSSEGLDESQKAALKSQRQSKIYQQQFQKALKSQVGGILDKMHGDNYSTISDYLNGCYEQGFVGAMYDIAKQGVPLVVPIDQAAVVKAVLTDSKVSNGLYNALGVNVGKLKKSITQEISRGIASALPYRDIARNLSNVSKAPLSRTKTIARTEGHRIQQTSAADAQREAKKKGADVVKQWDASLDARTRDSHAAIDGEIREIDDKFSNGLRFPGDPNGPAAEVINCRCTANTRARWALDAAELRTLQEHASFFGLDKTKNFEEYSKKYLGAVDKTEKSGILYNNKVLNTFEDPLREASGAGYLSNPSEINDMLQSLKTSGVEVKYRENVMCYQPGLSKGIPGKIVIDPEASFGAWSHEYTHFLDDKKDGFLGMRVLEDPQKCVEREIHAYNVEIEIAKNLGRPDMVERLEKLKRMEVERHE